MNFSEMIAQIKKVKDAIVAGDFAEAWNLTIPLQQKFIDWAKDLGFRASPDDEKNAKKLQEELTECKMACDAPRVASANQPKSKIGDGTILKLLLEAFLKFAPLFFKADPNKPVNEGEETQPREGTRAAKAQTHATANPHTSEENKGNKPK